MSLNDDQKPVDLNLKFLSLLLKSESQNSELFFQSDSEVFPILVKRSLFAREFTKSGLHLLSMSLVLVTRLFVMLLLHGSKVECVLIPHFVDILSVFKAFLLLVITELFHLL